MNTKIKVEGIFNSKKKEKSYNGRVISRSETKNQFRHLNKTKKKSKKKNIIITHSFPLLQIWNLSSLSALSNLFLLSLSILYRLGQPMADSRWSFLPKSVSAHLNPRSDIENAPPNIPDPRAKSISKSPALRSQIDRRGQVSATRVSDDDPNLSRFEFF